MKNISVIHFYKVAGYSYDKWGRYGDRLYRDLPKDIQDTVKVVLRDLYLTQKMVYSYEFEFTAHYMKRSGVKLKPFFDYCGMPAYFWQRYKDCGDPNKLVQIRMGLMRQVSEIIEFIRE